MPFNDRMKRPHEKVILELARKLKTDNPDANIEVNSKFRKKHHRVPNMPVDYNPDLIDFTNNVAYEVHVYGNRAGQRWDYMPQGWRGVAVFTVKGLDDAI